MFRILSSITLLLFTIHLASAVDELSFDVATIRVNQPAGTEGRRGAKVTVSPDSIAIRNTDLKSCIAWAYHVSKFQVSGPDWIDSERYDIAAKAPRVATEDELRRMLRTLLASRFNLTLHHETKVLPAYILSVGKNGPKAHESKTQGAPSLEADQKNLTVVVQRAPISMLVDMLSQSLPAPVIDKTGLTGRYDVTLELARYFASLQAGGGPPDIEGILAGGLEEELGLKLESKRTSLDVLVVDRANRTPTEN